MKRTATVVVARQMRKYRPGEKVRLIRGRFAGQVMTVHQCANDWVTLKEMTRKDPSRTAMSKGNVEPMEGFSEEEMNHAKRVAERLQEMGSLI